MENYKLIQEAKDRATARTEDTKELNARDVIAKIEYPNDKERYAPGFKDYHGPK